MKKFARKTVNRMLLDLPNSVESLRAQIIENKLILKKLEAIINTNSENQHREMRQLLEDLNSRVNNSGFIRISDTEIIAKIFSGAKIYLDPRDIGLVPHLILDGKWEHSITDVWLSLVEEKDTIFDIGANFGYFGLLAAQKSNKQAKIVLFEPNPTLIPYVNKTFGINAYEECASIENMGVSDENGVLNLNIIEGYIASSSMLSLDKIIGYNRPGMKLGVSKSIDVKTVTLDSYCNERSINNIDLIKMDIEGFEEKAYLGMRKIINNSSRVTMLLEFTHDAYDNPKKFYELMLADFGNVYVINDQGKLERPKSNKYEQVIDSSTGWAMPVFSKRKDLAY